jgi:hypothetical protein
MDMDSTGLKRKDTIKGPPLRVLSLGTSMPLLLPSLDGVAYIHATQTPIYPQG